MSAPGYFDSGDQAPRPIRFEPGSFTPPIAEATVVPYTPATPAKWPATPPGTVAQALDDLAAGSGSSASGLLATYSADNGATDVSILGTQTPIATTASITVKAGQKLNIHATACFSSGEISDYAIDMQVLLGATVVDETVENVRSSFAAAEGATVTRSFQISPVAGTYTVQLSASQGSGSTVKVLGTAKTSNGTPYGRLLVELVNVQRRGVRVDAREANLTSAAT